MYTTIWLVLLATAGFDRFAFAQPPPAPSPVAGVGDALGAVPLTQSGVPNFNVMNCADFLRHMGSTVPTRLGIFGSQAKRSYLAPTAMLHHHHYRYGPLLDQRLIHEPMIDSFGQWQAPTFDSSVGRRRRGGGRGNETMPGRPRMVYYGHYVQRNLRPGHHELQRRQFMAGFSRMGGFFRDLLGQVSNFNNQNTLNCQARPRLATCEQIDGQAAATLPQWFFDWQVMNNANHVATQLTQSPLHALFDAGYKAYKCMCLCA